ncbi:peroxidase-like isoform X3 [Aphis gossypii]|uniref:peroxidase-like isoform X3 n=1 Tax=Aphis gossypii TaxID=80765 RepID=UPI002158F3C4|nr:peroxidase-like isoform X3 [Aphis gossypii]
MIHVVWKTMKFINKSIFLILLIVLSKTQADSFDEVNLIKTRKVVIDNTFYEKCVSKQFTCYSSAKYRSMDGTCNNLQNPLWGSSFSPYIRLDKAYYADGNFSMRVQFRDGKPLPSARTLQVGIFWMQTPSWDIPDINNYQVNQFGQYLAHDITLMPSNFAVPPNDCCEVQGQKNIPLSCQAVIKVEANDPSYSIINKTCLPFKRAMTAAIDFNCPIFPQIPFNQQTAFIDASQLYGPTPKKAASLRSFQGGKLKTEEINGQKFGIQVQRNGSKLCGGRNNVNYCFNRGDVRNNQHFGLILYEETFLRFHNLITDLLIELNPHWIDETLYHEGRRIVIAFEEIIVYRDYLPILLGKDYCDSVGLSLSKDNKTVYDPTIMPQLAVEFSAAAFRIPHNVAPMFYYFLDQNYDVTEIYKLNEFMGIADQIVPINKLEELLRGMCYNQGRSPLPNYNPLITSRLFHGWVKGAADQDLASIDVQRGRDSGIPPYYKFREICGFKNITSFNDLDIGRLQLFYDSVFDIDFIVGALLEKNVEGGMVGETARCIIADSFFRSRNGDRFFFDVPDQPGSFTEEQLDVLWSLDLSQLFCLTTNIDQLPVDIFKPLEVLDMYDCKSIELNLGPWKVDNTG